MKYINVWTKTVRKEARIPKNARRKEKEEEENDDNQIPKRPKCHDMSLNSLEEEVDYNAMSRKSGEKEAKNIKKLKII